MPGDGIAIPSDDVISYKRRRQDFQDGAMSKRARSTRGQASSSREETTEEKFLSNKGLAQPFFNFINTDTFSRPQWVNLFQINEPIFRDLVRKFFALIEFDVSPFRFNVGNTKAKFIRNLRIKLAHRCIMMTITSRKETTNRVTEIDLFYLYCIFGERVVCNISYWLAKYLKSIRAKSVIFEGMFMTRIARSFGLLTNEIVRVLNCEPPLHVYRKTSLVKIGVIMELHEGECCWPATRDVVEEGEGEDEEGDGEGGNEGVGGSADIYRNMSQGDWQVRQARWMDQQDEHRGRIGAWIGHQDKRAHWMYNHTVRQFQNLSTRDNLNPHLQIDPFTGYEADYPPVGYQGYMTSGYAYMAITGCIITLLYLMRRSLEVLRKFHWMILEGRSNQLSHVSSPLLSKPGEY
ncbi:hypothetical protein Tco_1055783 [Tanacetum coccineum]|uniref:Uncharacterized protein n=1 Tax=Tanacetum coccineum TaxID=301880 RepID=A0ABQ5H0R2_9ASTR